MMKLQFKRYILLICTVTLTVGVSYLAMASDINDDPFADPDQANALNRTDDNAAWIAKWLMLDGLINNTGGFAASAPIDWLSEGTGGSITQESISTLDGLRAAEGSQVNLPDNGGTLRWRVTTIDPNENNNMSVTYGLTDETNVDTYAIIVIDSPDARNTIMSPAHDDHAQIWINGDKCYNNSAWTGGHHQVDFDVEVSLNRGLNVLLYRCGESGGDDHFNLHFQDSDSDLVTYPDANDRFFEVLVPGTAVEPGGKLSTTWGEIKHPR
jgi:hypothetical protein